MKTALSNPGLVSDHDNTTVTRRWHGLPSYSVYGLPAPASAVPRCKRAGPSSSVYTSNNEDVVLIARSREHPTN